ncbi:MAG: hypothetical protein NPIRA01_31090 [Nitrospirales bacterium]|nr:MAG: hypothetical protein NPIRA01_31090 [Nitrospirales bacterium]
MHEWMPGMGWGFGPLFMIVFWILVVLGIFFLGKELMSRASEGATPQESESALEILKKRYARGEINKEEFEEKRKDLE